MRKILALAWLLGLLCLTPTLAYADEVGPAISFSNPEGMWDDEFLVYQTVYVEGSGFASEVNLTVYLVPHQDWMDGMAIPDAVDGTCSMVASDSEGNVSATVVWEPYLTVGLYEIVVDVDDNGFYDSGTDVTDEMRVRYALGVQGSESPEPEFVVPELPFGTVLVLLAFLTALGLHRRRLETPHL